MLLGAGLVTRYLLRRKQLSTVLLVGVPVLDGVLLTLLAWDMLINDTVASFAHGLGAVYLGFTLAFGRSIISRVDAWFAHRFAGGRAPVKVPKHGLARMKYEWREWFKMVLCAVISLAILAAFIALVNDPVRTEELNAWIYRVLIVTGVWLVGWPVWESGIYVLRGEK